MRTAERLIHNVTMSPASPRAGQHLEFRCSFRYVFSQVQVRVRSIVWYLNAMRLSPTESAGRIRIRVVDPDLTGTWISTLTFQPAAVTDSGMCRRLWVKCGRAGMRDFAGC